MALAETIRAQMVIGREVLKRGQLRLLHCCWARCGILGSTTQVASYSRLNWLVGFARRPGNEKRGRNGHRLPPTGRGCA